MPDSRRRSHPLSICLRRQESNHYSNTPNFGLLDSREKEPRKRMVLSNKKLKQKLKSANAELITTSEAQNNFTNKDSETSIVSDPKALNSLSTLPNPEDQRHTLTIKGLLDSREELKKRMVLSNKKQKQKQKLRSSKAELITASEVQNNFTNKDSETSIVSDPKALNSLSTFLYPEDEGLTLRQREKREKRRQRPGRVNSGIIIHRETVGDVDAKKEDELKSHDVDVKEKKRKRNETEALENVDEKKPKQLKKKKKAKNKRKPKKKAGPKEEGNEQNGSGGSAQQVVAKAFETTDSKQDVEPSSRVYVGGIPYYSTEDDIRSYFESCGTITAIDCMSFPDTGKFRGIAIITFKTEAAAKRALALDGSDMGGLFLKIQPFKSAKANKQPNFSPAVLEGYNRIYIGNLSWDVTENDLRKLFSDCTITTIRFGEDKETGEFKGYAHVDFANNLSLNNALKLDQTIVCGRPVRISCAVAKNGAAIQLKPMPKDDRVAYSEVPAVPAVSVDQVDSSAVSSKIRRRTCYDCGEKGHVSSACPKNQAADVANPGSALQLKSLPQDDPVDYSEVPAVPAFSIDRTDSNAKIRRRTCYECGEKGHVSLSCPKKQADDVANTGAAAVQINSMPKDYYQVDYGEVPAVTAVNLDQVDSSVVSALNSKIRRRTCYECGGKGHLSTSCPKKLAADLANTGMV